MKNLKKNETPAEDEAIYDVVMELTEDIISGEAAEVVQTEISVTSEGETKAPTIVQVAERLSTGFMVEIKEAIQP